MVREWQRERLLVVAKTYPECSKKYGCLICTVGLTSAGEWRRLYPIPWAYFWRKNGAGFKVWDEIDVPIIKNPYDHRPESFKVNPGLLADELRIVGSCGGWPGRRGRLVPVLDADLEGLRQTPRSLGMIRPYAVHDFVMRERHRVDDPDEVLTLERTEQAQQTLLLDTEPLLMKQSRTPPDPLPWIGYEFSCAGPACRGHAMMVLDWGIQQLFRRYGVAGFEKVREAALRLAADRDLYFIMGTTWRFKRWMIVGLFQPPQVPS